MAFCKYCGNQLQEGQLCGCEKAVAARATVETPVAPVQQQAPVEQQPVYQQAPVQQPVYQQAPVQQQPVYQQAPYQQAPYQQAPYQQAPYQQAPYQQAPYPYPYPQAPKGPNPFQVMWTHFIGVWKKPVEGGSNFVKNGTIAAALILMGIQALLSGFLALAQLGKVEATIKDAMGPMLSWYGESIDLGLPYGKLFFIVLIMSIVVSGLYIGGLFGGLKIFKGTESIKEVMNVAALRSIAAIPFTLLALIFTIFHMGIALVINALALCVSLIFMVLGAKGLESLEENKRAHFILIVKIVVLIVALIIVWLVAKGTIGDIMSGIGSYIGDLF